MATLPPRPIPPPPTGTAPRPGAPRQVRTQRAPTNLSDHRARLLYIGPPFAGKTTMMASWHMPDQERELFMVSWDKKLESFFKAAPGAPYIVPDSPKQFREEILPWMLEGGLAHDHPNVWAVGFDTISFYARDLELEIMGSANAMSAKDGDWQVFSNRIANDFAQLGRLVTGDLPKNFHFLAGVHEKEKYTAVKGSQGSWEQRLIGIDPAISGQTARMITGYFDCVLYLTRKVEMVTQAGAPAKQVVKHIAYATEPADHRAPAGGTIWGKTLPPGELEDVTYAGLRRLCGLEP